MGRGGDWVSKGPVLLSAGSSLLPVVYSLRGNMPTLYKHIILLSEQYHLAMNNTTREATVIKKEMMYEETLRLGYSYQLYR